VVKRAGKRTWWPELVVWEAVGGSGVAAGVVLAGEFEVSWLEPIGRYGDRLVAHKELQRFSRRERTW
jgi:hypothetical protein